MNIKDIANLSGVSASTVSKVLNNKDAGITDKTRERVLSIIRQYHYTPYAKISSQTKKWRIAVLLRSSISFDSTLDGIIKTAQSAGYGTIVFNSYSDIEQEKKNLNALTKHKVDGVIWEPVSNKSHQKNINLTKTDIPWLTIGPNGGDNSLLIPYRDAAYKLTEQLLTHGHTHIGCLMKPGRRDSDFLSGFQECLFDYHQRFNDQQVFWELNDQLIEKISNHSLTAFIASHYSRALEFYQLMTSLHYQIPDDISLASIKNDTIERFTPNNNIEISTYTIRNSDFGSYLCSKLINMMEKKQATPTSFVQEFHLDNKKTISTPTQLRQQKIVVIAPIMVNTYLSVNDLPKTPSTITAQASTTHVGGSGFSQTISIAKLQQRVSLIANVGSDSDADQIYKTLKELGIDTSGISRSSKSFTGKAYSLIDTTGKSITSVLPGANQTLTDTNIKKHSSLFNNSAYCLIDGVTPNDAILSACVLAHQNNAQTILTHTTNKILPVDLIREIDTLITNSTTLQTIIKNDHTIDQKVQEILNLGIFNVILATQTDGYYLYTKQNVQHFKVNNHDCPYDNHQYDLLSSVYTACLLNGQSTSAALRAAIDATSYATAHDSTTPLFIDPYTLQSEIIKQ